MLIYGLVLIAVAVVLLAVWYVWFRARHGEEPPETAGEEANPPADRDQTWDPHERYEHEEGHEPPAAR